MFNPVEVTPLSEFWLRVRYSDGVEGEVDLSHLAGKGVFSIWDDPQVFQAVTIGEAGEIRWSENVDLCSDSIYLEITGKTPEEVFPGLGAVRDA